MAHVYFLKSPQVTDLLEAIPTLVRRLPTSSTRIREVSAERVRGAIDWPATLNGRASGSVATFVTRPASRIYSTPENELLVFMLRMIRQTVAETGWLSRGGSGNRLVEAIDSAVTRWLSLRMLASLPARRPSPRDLMRIKMGRHAAAFAPVLAAYELYIRLFIEVDVSTLKELVETEV